MRILHVIPAVAERYGGPSQLVVGMCRALAAAGIHAEIATTDADGDARLDVPHGILQEWQGVPVRFFRCRRGEALKHSPDLAHWLETHVAGFDVVHVHAVFSHACLAAARACRENGIPYVIRPLGTLDPWSMGQKTLRKRAFLACGGRRMLAEAAAIQYTTEREREAVEKTLALGAGVVIPNGLSVDAVDHGVDRENFSRRFPELEAGRFVLALGRLHPKKNLERLIAAFGKVRADERTSSLKLVIAGRGDTDYERALHRFVERSRAAESVVFTGWVEGEDKQALLRNARLLVLPSSNENYGIAVAEAMAVATPVLVSDEVYLADDIHEAGAGWVVGAGQSLAETMQRALLAPDECQRRGHKGRQLVHRKFTWEVVAARLGELYARFAIVPPAGFRGTVSVMIFTLDEETNLPQCLASLDWCDDIIVIDSGSQDSTCLIAREAGARVFTHDFEGFGSQRNWAIDHCHPRHDWILILDADESVPRPLVREINDFARQNNGFGAARLRRRFHMWGRWLRYSSLYPTWVVRLVHRERVRYINRGHAETQEVQGDIHALEADLIDENLKGVEHWYARQARYAKAEAQYEMADSEAAPGELGPVSNDPLERQAALKRLARRLPFRRLAYFLYAYLWRQGFRDGTAGLRFCRMRAWYQGQVVRYRRELAKR